MRTSRKAGRHLAVRQAVAGQAALEQLGRHRPDPMRRMPTGSMDDAGRALAKHLVQCELFPCHRRA